MPKKNKPKFKCKSEAQKKAIRRNYAIKAKSSKTSARVESPYPHFRYYKKSGHPALIVGEQTGIDKNSKPPREIEEYRYRKVMHGEKDGRHSNEIVMPNPDPCDPNPMYIAKRIRHDEKENFEDQPLPWKYHKKSNARKRLYPLAMGVATALL